MPTDDTQPWVILRLQQGLRDLWLNYEDSRGQKRVPTLDLEPSPCWTLQPVQVPGELSLELHVPQDFQDSISQLLKELPQQTGITRQDSLPLPVFFEPPAFSRVSDWRSILTALLRPPIDANRIQFVRLTTFSRTSRLQPRPFELPLHILALSESYGPTLTSLLGSYWYQDNPDVQRYGLSVTWGSASDATRRLKAESWDIVLTDEQSVAQTILHTQETRFRRLQPRLIVFTGSTENQDYVNSLNLRAGSALMWIPQLQEHGIDPPASEFLINFLYGLIHDYPLHQALKVAAQFIYMDPFLSPILVADPVSVEALRLSSALSKLVARADEIRHWRRLGDIEQFLWRAGEHVNVNLRDNLLTLDHSRAAIQTAIKVVKQTPDQVIYDHETEGLVHLAGAAAALETAAREHRNIYNTTTAIVNVPELAEAFEQFQERSVDIAVQERDANGEYQKVNTAAPLQQYGDYRVQVHVGHPGPDSVMIGDVPPLDPLLAPSDEGYELEVALFEKDFEALSPTLQKMYLPRLGRSEPVYFEIRAPESKGVAEARIGIYYENNLVQSFLLKANVDSNPTEQPEPLKIKLFVAAEQEGDYEAEPGKWIEVEADQQVLSALAFTQSARLSNLADLGRREFSIGINDDVEPGNHTFMVKTDGEAKGLTVKDKILSDQTDAFRNLLKTNTQDANEDPLFETYPSAADASKPGFLKLIQKLIEMGAELYGFIYNNLPETMRAKLSELTEQSDKTIQVVRFDIRNVFPWQIIYDYQLPIPIAGGSPPEICLAYEATNTAPGKASIPVKKCSHGPFDEVYCLSGFWGLRLQIEQLFKLPAEKTDTIKQIVPGSKDSFIRLAVSTDDDPAKKLSDGLTTEIGAAFVNSPSSQDLLDLMWNDSTRPAVLIVMGHFEKKIIAGEPTDGRIVLVPKKQWFLAREILKRFQKAKGRPWQQPNTLVLLMACSSGATEISTLNDFVTNLNSAGAAAVLGTECLVFSSLVGRFARDVISDLWQGRKLGEAVKLFNRRLVSAGNPLSFVFNSLGNADLELIKPSS